MPISYRFSGEGRNGREKGDERLGERARGKGKEEWPPNISA